MTHNHYNQAGITAHLSSPNVTCVYGRVWSPTLTVHTLFVNKLLKVSLTSDYIIENKATHLYNGNKDVNQPEIKLFPSNNKSKRLKITHWNVQCITNKMDQLKQIVRDTKSQPNILGLTETWLTDTYKDSYFKLPGYHHPPEHKDRTCAAHGGVIAYVSKDMDYHRRKDIESGNTESLWIEVECPNTSNVLISTVYRPEEDKLPI